MVLTWLALLAALAVEAAAAVQGEGWAGWLVAPVMAGLIAANFMHLRHGSALSRIFAAAGLFWVCVMLGLGGADYLTRHDFQAERDIGSTPHIEP